MSTIYYKIPLPLTSVMEGKQINTCDLRQSISKNIELIIMTRFEEHRSDPDFGCEIWDLDFELIVSERLWEEKLRQSLLKSIKKYETRLSNVDIAVAIREVEKFYPYKQFTEIKNKVDIQLKSIILKTGEVYTFSTNLYLSPLAMD